MTRLFIASLCTVGRGPPRRAANLREGGDARPSLDRALLFYTITPPLSLSLSLLYLYMLLSLSLPPYRLSLRLFFPAIHRD